MENRNDPAERRECPRVQIKLPYEYWETCDTSHGGLVENLSETGLLIHSIEDMEIGSELEIKVFFYDGYEFDLLKLLTRIVWKGNHCQDDWQGYKYGLRNLTISQEDQIKLSCLLRTCPQPNNSS
jgi:hypothetical protein